MILQFSILTIVPTAHYEQPRQIPQGEYGDPPGAAEPPPGGDVYATKV